jgi:predicted ArsR family transcriptional regulator
MSTAITLTGVKTRGPNPAPSGSGEPDGLDALSALSEPTRRALYELVARSGDWVSRDAAADAVGIERGTAAHHLDRLAADGLVEVDYRRLSGRQGPGAGRPAKLYRRAHRDIEVTLPRRDYGLAGRLLAEAADRSRLEGSDITAALDEAASAEGERLAASIRSRLGADNADTATGRAAVVEALGEQGFEPEVGPDGTVVLRNCPFHQLAQKHQELICGMNHCLLTAAVEQLDGLGMVASLEPEEGHCCVKLRPVDQAG